MRLHFPRHFLNCCFRKKNKLPSRNNCPSRKYFVIFAFLFAAVFLCYSQINITDVTIIVTNNASTYSTKLEIEKYLIHTSTCRIPDANPFNEDVGRFVHRVNQMQCSRHEVASYVTINDEAVTLNINRTALKTYSMLPVKCCYSRISRIIVANESDDTIGVSTCEPFETAVNLTVPTVMLECRNSFGGMVYSNVHTVVDKRFVSEEEKKTNLKQNSPLSVVFVGIDSISKMNLVRTMPKVHKFLKSHDFINLKGYTKIGDNTFPNVMAILTGKTTEQVYAHCEPAKKKMNGCDIIWDKFRKLGYVTAYAEDQSSIATFNYNRMGFDEPPTTFYFRPYVIASERLPERCGKRHYCAGPITFGERIMTLVKDFLINLKNTPKFGFFWMSTFSHDDVNMPSSMDGRVEAFLKDVYEHLENTILIFFSDHGFRFGELRFTHTGYVEERLPFIYIHLPNTFKEQYAEEYNSFVVNSERLTNPFDMYMTLQDIIRFNNDNYTIEPSQACPKCQSLFKEISEKRTCKDGAIDQHWCLCTGNSYIDVRKPIVQATSEYILSEVNKIVKSYKKGAKLCAQYYLKKVVSAGMSEVYSNEYNTSVNNFVIIIETRPPAMFEATVEGNFQIPQKPEFRLLGDISRLDRYADKSACVDDHILEKYCYCDGLFTSIKSAICNFFNCLSTDN